MRNSQIVKAVFEALESGDFDEAADWMSDELVFSGPVPEPIGKDAFIDVSSALYDAFSDFTYNAKVLREDGDVVEATCQLTGKHTDELAIPGFPVVQPTNKTFRLPVEHMRCVFDGDELKELNVEKVPGGGVPGILTQLGVEAPVTRR